MKSTSNYLRKFTFAVCVSMTASVTVTHADVNARYGELQSVIDAINDPDPLMRLAQLEDILKRGNVTDVQLAIRTAFEVDDPNVRSLALRSHFASFKTFIITAEIPKEIQQIINGKDEKAREQLYRYRRDYLEFLGRIGNQFAFISKYPETTELEFAINALNNNPEVKEIENYIGTGNIRGGLVAFVANVRIRSTYLQATPCSFELTEYEGFTLKGTGSCDMDGAFPFPITLHLFDNDKPPVVAN